MDTDKLNDGRACWARDLAQEAVPSADVWIERRSELAGDDPDDLYRIVVVDDFVTNEYIAYLETWQQVQEFLLRKKEEAAAAGANNTNNQ